MPPNPKRPGDEVVDADAASVPAGPDRTDGSAELDKYDTLRVLFLDPAVRNYVIAAFSALAMIFLVMFQDGSDLGAVLVLMLGTAGILLRFPAAPALVLFVIVYFSLFPFGIPGDAYERRWEIEERRFALPDLMMAVAVLVYVACQFRILGFVHQAVAFEGAARRKDEPITRRPPATVSPIELGVLLGVSAAAVFVGQFVWWLVNAVEFVPGETFLLDWAEPGRFTRRSYDRSLPPGGLPPNTTRFFVLVGGLFFGVLAARLVFGYWRLRTMKPAEGAMILLDGGWDETKRERSRFEKWRIWGWKRAEAGAKVAEAAGKANTGRKR